MGLNTKKNKPLIISWLAVMIFLFAASLFTGKYPLTVSELIQGNSTHIRVFVNLRLGRAFTALIGGFALGVSGFVFQCIFRNPLASPDVIGISSGASAGAAFAILFCTGTVSIIFFSFTGGLLSLFLTLLISSFDRYDKSSTFVISGIIVHTVAQSVLMSLKITADPEKQLASIEYWIMGGLNGISTDRVILNLLICIICIVFLFLSYRRIMLLTIGDDEAKMLGINVSVSRLIILLFAALSVSSVISITGVISFISLLPAHIARLIRKDNSPCTMLLSGLIGSSVLLFADILAKTISTSELPLSIFTSLTGAPVLVYFLLKERRND